MNKLEKILLTITLTALTAMILTNYKPKIHPTSDKDIASTTAMITNYSENSGGSGVILTSKTYESTVLTNAHVCGVVKFGGLVITDRKV